MLCDADITTRTVRRGEDALGEYPFENSPDINTRDNLDLALKMVLQKLKSMDSILPKLLEPMPPERFMSKYWTQRPLLIQNEHNRRLFPTLYTQEMLTAGILENGYNCNDYRFVNDHGYHPNDEFFSTGPGRIIDAKEANTFFKKHGGSILIDNVHRYHRRLNKIWQALVSIFAFPVTCTAYFTPPGRETFPAHWDTDDVFIFHLNGEKRWTVYEPIIRDPLEHHRWEQYECEFSNQLIDSTLQAGDLLYVPRGFPHRVQARPEAATLHVTFGICIPTWHMSLKLLLEDLLVQCGQEMAFRQPCPVVMGRNLTQSAAKSKNHDEYFTHLLDSLGEKLTTEALRDSVERFMTRHVLWGTMEHDCDAPITYFWLSPKQQIYREERLYFLTEGSDGVTLKFGGKAVSFPVRASSAIQWLIRETKFCVQDLPGPLTEEENLVIVKRLLREELLTTRLVD